MSRWEINFKENKQVWDAFSASSPQRSIFVYTKFLDSLLANYDLVTCYEKSKIVAGAVLIYSDAGEPIARPHPFTQYQGVLLADNANQSTHSQITHEFKVVEYFISQLTEYYKKCCFCHSWRLNDLRPFLWHNYHELNKGQFNLDLRYTGILDLKKYHDFEIYLASVRSCRRQEFKKSSQLLMLEFSDDEAILDSLHAMTFARQNIQRNHQDAALLKSICRHAVAGGYGKLSLARLEGLPVAAVLFIYDDRTAYYLFGANDPAFRSSNAGGFLLLQMIKDAFETEMEEIDFVGINSPSRGDYKISLNAELKAYHLTTLINC